VTGSIEPFLWFGGGTFGPAERGDEPAGETVLAYLARNDVSVVVTDNAATVEEAGGDLDHQLAAAADAGVDVLLNAGMVPGPDQSKAYTDRELIEDEATMEAFLEPLRETARVYETYYPEGRLLLWHEAPIMGNWTGDSYAERAESVVEYGPAIFAAQKRAVREVSPDLDVAVFPHDIPMAPPERSTAPICERLFEGLAARDATPDFVFVDSYRSHHEWAAGCEPSNEFVHEMLANVTRHADVPVYYLGETHTDNNHYTPSKGALEGNVRAALDAGVEGYGWYSRGRYHRTSDRCYDPFVPNTGTVAEDQFTTLTGSRDRLLWATLLAIERRPEFDPEERFDLWVHGRDFEFHEHRLSVRDSEGDWELLGDVSGYADGDNPYAGADRTRVSVFHALDRSLLEGGLEVRVESRGDGDLLGLYAVPHLEPGLYLTEPEATTLLADGTDLDRFLMGGWDGSLTLSEGDHSEVTVDTAGDAADPVELVYPEQAAAYRRMIDLEDTESVRECFDLWVWGSDLDGLSATVGGESVDRFADPLPAEKFGETEAVVYRGLRAEEFLHAHPGGHYVDLALGADDRATIRGVYAMPCGGARNFRGDAEVAATVAADYEEGAGQIEGFALGRQTWPRGATAGRGDAVETWVHVPNRRAVGGRPEGGTGAADGMLHGR
jgi:hypothetical protein